MGYDNFLEDQYKVPLLAKILHSLPHLNITFHRTNNTFRPTDEIYLEVRRCKALKINWNNLETFACISIEPRNIRIAPGSRFNHLIVLSPALLDVEMLRS